MPFDFERIVALFSPPGERVCAVPRRSAARLIFPSGGGLPRWGKTGLYPAFRTSARAARLVIRICASCGFPSSRNGGGDRWLFGEFLREVLPEPHSVVVLIGTERPAQKVCVQVWDARGSIIGYVKYGESPVARRRIRNEAAILGILPHSCSHVNAMHFPQALKLGNFGEGEALVLTPVSGRRVGVRLPPSSAIRRFVFQNGNARQVPAGEHPFLRDIAAGMKAAERWVAGLGRRCWPVGLMHGDFAPWNLLIAGDGEVALIDWEYARVDGLPCIDLAHYLLQVAHLICNWTPERALRYVAAYLSTCEGADIQHAEAESLTRIAARFAHAEAIRDGSRANNGPQCWHQRVWEAEI